MVRCLNTWKESTTESVRLKNVCKRVAARWHKAGLVRVLSNWIAYVVQRTEDRTVVRCWLSAVQNRDLIAAWRKWRMGVRDLNNASHLAVLHRELESTNHTKIKQAAHQQTELIRERMNQLRTEMSQRDALVGELRRQLKSQEKVGAQMSTLARDLAHSQENYSRVQTDLKLSRDMFDSQVMELRGESGHRLSSLEIQVRRAQQKSATLLAEERNTWVAESTRLEGKIVFAKQLMEKKNNTIRGLRKEVQEKEEVVVVLEHEKKVGVQKIQELKFRLHELVLDQIEIEKSQKQIEDAIRAKQREKDGKVIKLDTLEELVGRELKILNQSLDGCVDTVKEMKRNNFN